MRVIFLDIDGVLNSEDYAKRYHKEHLREKGYHIFVDPDAVELVKELCEETNCKIIISSSWRGFTLKDTIADLNGYRDLQPLTKYIIGVTPRSAERHRGKEIEMLLNNWERCVDRSLIHSSYRDRGLIEYAIVDDDSDILPTQKGHFVQTDWSTGITKEDIDWIKEVLFV